MRECTLPNYDRIGFVMDCWRPAVAGLSSELDAQALPNKEPDNDQSNIFQLTKQQLSLGSHWVKSLRAEKDGCP